METQVEAPESLSDIMAGSSPFASAEPAKVETKAEAKAEVKAVPEVKAETKVEAKTDEKPQTKAAPKAGEAERDDQGRFTKTVPQEALHAERRKRQELEAQLQTLNAAKPKTSVFEDEDKAISERVDAATAPLKQRFFNMSIKSARQGRADYDQALEAFANAAESDPRLSSQLRDHDDPGEFIYAVGTQIRELADVGGDIVKYGEKKTSAVKAELEVANARIKTLEAEVETVKKGKQAIDEVPGSLNKSTSGPAPTIGDEDPEDVKNIVRFNKR